MTGIDDVVSGIYIRPTAREQSDGTLSWNATTMIVVQARAGQSVGIGYTYSQAGAARVIEDTLKPVVQGGDPLAVSKLWNQMWQAIRNFGPGGIAAHAMSAVDCALWDLKARLLHIPLCDLLGCARAEVPVYESGGFTSDSLTELSQSLVPWKGSARVKIKIGRVPSEDLARVRVARDVLGPGCELFVDANGAYTPAQAIAFAQLAAPYDIRWFEEPVSSNDLAGLRQVRRHAPAGLQIAAGEYGNSPFDFRTLLAADALDVLQADATRCMGISGLLIADSLCTAYSTPLSLHTAPALHLHPGAALRNVVHVERFVDHVAFEEEMFEGAPSAEYSIMKPRRESPGNGLALNEEAARRYRA